LTLSHWIAQASVRETTRSREPLTVGQQIRVATPDSASRIALIARLTA
jgi:hypothetical protein